MSASSAIYVRNVIKNYGEKTVLNGLSMTVERGTIYGLLGSSGCGKTTLLSCIIGRKGINSGEICVLGTPQGNGVLGSKIGYMPQELGLVEEFTVGDTMYYFGTIFKMKSRAIKERLAYLTKLLELPPADRFLKDCSGGQKRRVSFAAALIHNPELLILDEPTVGVDPILREKIWDYLRDQVDTKKITVIITTHYIEETKNANKIGLLRGGKLLTEETPTNLLLINQTDSLEQVFFILSKKQESEKLTTSSDGITNALKAENTTSLESISTNTSIESFVIGYGSRDELTKSSKNKNIKRQYRSALDLDKNRMKALLDKNWKQFYRNVGGIFFFLTLPVMQLFFFANSVGTDPKGLNLGIVNDESFTTLCDSFNWNETAVTYDYECRFKNLTCRYLRYLEDPMINKILYNSLSGAVEGIKHGHIIGVLYIPSNFTETFEERISLGRHAQNWTIEFGEMKVYMDMSNRQTGVLMKSKLLKLFIDFQKKLFVDCNLPEKAASVPMQLNFIYGSDTQEMTLFSMPGMVIVLLYFLGCSLTANIIVKEKQEGIWDRSMIAGVSSIEITLSHLLVEGAILVVQCLEAIIMLFFVLKLEYVGNLWAMFVLSYLNGICGMAYGFCISAVSNNFTQVMILSTGGYMPLLLIGGIIWPLEGMPVILKNISILLPCTLSSVSFRNVMLKGWSLWHPQVFNGVGVALLWIGLFAAASIWFIKIKK